jgi:hypothetical protein
MRDPDLVQRAERASIVLEQAWERWREMHGLGAEPLPPVSSYVGYSLEEPWGQPRVVFGLRADEAELLASLLEGHDCPGSVYAEVNARPDWRNQSVGPASVPLRAYGDTFSVPAQARPPAADLIGPSAVADYADLPRPEFGEGEFGEGEFGEGEFGEGERAVQREPGRRGMAARRRPAASGRGPVEAHDPVGSDDDRWHGLLGDALGQPGGEVGAARASMTSSPPLTPLPSVVDFPMRPDYLASEPTELAAAPPRSGSGPADLAAPGPGYRGPRYQGYPPRYDPDAESRAATPEAPPVADDGGTGDDARPDPPERQQVARLSRPPRKRTKTVRAAEKPPPTPGPPVADQAR